MALWSKQSTVYPNDTWDIMLKRMTDNTLAVEIEGKLRKEQAVVKGKISKSRDQYSVLLLERA